MTASFDVLRLNAGENGGSYFDSYSVDRPLVDFAPPALPLHVSAAVPAAAYVAVRLPAGWVGEPHPSPRRQILFCLRGSMRMTTSDGDTRIVSAGDALLMGDTSGEGHKTEVISAEPVDAVIIQLAETA